MASPKVMSDADDTPLNEANLNKYVAADGAKVTSKKWWGRVRYTGSAPEIVATVSTSGLTTPAVAWDTNHYVVTVGGFTEVPVVQVSQNLVATPYHVQAEAVDVDEVHVRFYTLAGALVTTQDTSMSFDIEISGA